MKFVPLHCHSGGSLYDGFGTPKQRAEQAKSLGFSHLAITDHGSMSMNELHAKYCKEVGNLQHIQGVEAYFMTNFQPGKEYVKLRRHLTLLARSLTGYKNLCKIMTRSNLDNFYIKPIADFSILEQFCEDVICLSGCVLGEIPQQILAGDFDEACRVTEQFLHIYGDNFYFEVQPQEFDDQKRANEGIIKLSEKFNRPAVMTNDSHFVSKEDIDTYLLFRRMGRNEIDDVKLGEIREQYKNLYIATGEEMNIRWKRLMGTDGTKFIEASQDVANTTENYDLLFEEKVPEYIEYDDNCEIVPAEKILAKKTKAGLIKRGLWKEPYIQRAKNELKVIIKQRDKVDYYLLTADIVNFAKENDVPVGPGRGSGCASLVAYALGITNVDPIYFDLMFERFIHEERLTIPDFDIDFSSKHYGKVINYLTNKFEGKVAQICNVLYYRGDNLINDLGKSLLMSEEEIKVMKLLISAMGFKEKDSKSPELSKLLFNKKLKILEDKYGVITHFCKIYNNPKAYGQHASGVAITPDQIDNYIPLFVRGKDEERRINTSFDMESLTRMRIVKVDILKLDYVDIVEECCKKLGITTDDIPLDDDNVYASYRKLNTKGIFQFDSPGGITVLERVKPENIFHLMDATSLDRPGALSLDQTRVYVEGKEDSSKIDTTTLLYPYCKRTYGAFLYQEQIMNACRGIAGMSWGQASKVMKNLDALPADHPLTVAFVEGAKRISKLNEKTSTDLFRKLTSYTFNQGHAAAYAVLSYWGMWIKVHHPEIFFLELLRASAAKKNIKSLEADSISNNIPIFLPHVNGESNYHLFEPFPSEYAIRSGINTIPNVGGVASIAIERENKRNGPFTSKEEFLQRVNGTAGRKVITSRVLTALEEAGALEFDFEIVKKRTIEYNSYLIAQRSWRRKQ